MTTVRALPLQLLPHLPCPREQLHDLNNVPRPCTLERHASSVRGRARYGDIHLELPTGHNVNYGDLCLGTERYMGHEGLGLQTTKDLA